MKKSYILLGLIVLIGVLMPAEIQAVNPSQRNKVDLVWRKNASSRTGLYSKQSTYVSNGVSISVNGMYYYGDVDRRGTAFNGGFKLQNLSVGGSFSFAYMMPLSTHCNWRFGLLLGALHGDNSDSYPDSYRKFDSFLAEASAGVEYYPFAKAGFYIYGGIGLTYSYVKYNFMLASGRANTFLPTIPLELGYDFRLGRSWQLRLYAGVHQGLVDAPGLNLDAYPQTSLTNKQDVSFGRGGGNKWADGYFLVGVCLSYHWHNCEQCRVVTW